MPKGLISLTISAFFKFGYLNFFITNKNHLYDLIDLRKNNTISPEINNKTPFINKINGGP